MQPIQELLSRIRWDREFANGRFVIGYYDRLEKRIIRVSFGELRFDKGDCFAFELTDTSGEEHSVPLHRVHEVIKDGKMIWARPLSRN